MNIIIVVVVAAVFVVVIIIIIIISNINIIVIIIIIHNKELIFTWQPSINRCFLAHVRKKHISRITAVSRRPSFISFN